MQLSADPDLVAFEGDDRLANGALFGAKAAGLHELPASWTPPYFAISTRGAHSLSGRRSQCALSAAIERLGKCPDGLMVRSSAATEDLDERGRFDSGPCEATAADVVSTIDRLGQACSEPDREELAFIVQRRVLSQVSGHLSNERRVSRDPRSWLCEAEVPVNHDDRSFRFRTGDVTRSTGGLECAKVEQLGLVLRWAARNLGGPSGTRAHLEWVWDGTRVWIVQRDADLTPGGRPPGDASKLFSGRGLPPHLSLFRHASSLPRSKFPKARQVATLADAGLPHGDVFVLAGARVVASLASGRVSAALERDLTGLIEAPVVVRTDVISQLGRPVLMSKRTDTCRTLDQLIKFLTDTAMAHVAGGGAPGSLAFLAHRFLPAQVGVFARARPGQSRVQVDATWGFPDSLFYYPHDTFLVDIETGSVNRHLRCKAEFIDIDENGDWKPRRSGRPWDWRASLSLGSAATIARASLTLAEFCGKELEIMFFAGTDNDGGDWSLPWFFDEVEHDNQVPAQAARGFYVGDRHRIRNGTDIRKLEAALTDQPDRPVILTLRPDVDLLRDRGFVSEVAALATKFRLPVELEGSLLSHVYYLLEQAGVAVRAVDVQTRREPRRAFGKLVRDLVPVRIERRGELADVYHPEPAELVPIVRAKLVEEALEHYWARSPHEAREELADLLEIIRTAARVQGLDIDDIEETAAKKREKRGGFDAGIVLVETRDPSDRGGARSLLASQPRGDRLRSVTRRPIRLPSRRMLVPIVPPDGWAQGKTYIHALDAVDEIAFTYGKDEILLEVRPRPLRPDANQLRLDFRD
jgi:predicted house-cleaning noncanonical NTP pyrophosphatase (MazG superfamily)